MSARKGWEHASPSVCLLWKCVAMTRVCGICLLRWLQVAFRTPSLQACICGKTPCVGHRYTSAFSLSETTEEGRGSTLLGLKPLNTCVLRLFSHSSRTRMSCGHPQQRKQPSTWMRPWQPAALVMPAAGRTPGAAPTCSSHFMCISIVWRSVAKEEVGAWCYGTLSWHLPALVGISACMSRCPDPSTCLYCFQCLEVAAACTSSTWAAVRQHSAEAGRLLEDLCVCRCPLWVVSSWPWSMEPSMCPTGEYGSKHKQGDL